MALGKNLAVFLSAAMAALIAIALLPTLDHSWRSWKQRNLLADTVVINATVYTSDNSLPFAQAIAIKNGRIIRVGDYSSIQDLIGHDTYKLNLNGKVVLPGFIDSHLHVLWGGLQMVRVQLRGVRSKEDFISKVKEAVKDKSPGQWILGGGWNNDFWGGDCPVASWLDEFTPQNPVWLSRMDGHMGLANSLALRIAGITGDALDPIGGTIMKTTDGELTGLLVDTAMNIVTTVIPKVSIEERRDAMLRASRLALMRGVTTVVDLGRYLPGQSDYVWQDLSEVYEWADSVGKMMIRVCLFFPIPTWSQLADLIREKGRSLSQWIHLGGVKAFADGSLGSNSALFYEPYEDDPSNCGIQVADTDWLFNLTAQADKSGLQVAIHAIGDKANDLVLDMYDSVVSLNGARDRRFRIEHAQHLVPSTTNRFGQQMVIASVQPDHLLDDAGSAEKKIGESRAKGGSYLFHSILTGGAQLAFGSDWPVVDINPLQSIKTAMFRKLPTWDHAWIPSERISLDDALKAYTISAAHACFLDQELGSISPGKYADFVVLPANSWNQFVDNVSGFVFATYVNGKQVYP